jgi:hypothetical protein
VEADWEGYKAAGPTGVEKLAAQDGCVVARHSEGKGKGTRNPRCSQRKRWGGQKKFCRCLRICYLLSALDPPRDSRLIYTEVAVFPCNLQMRRGQQTAHSSLIHHRRVPYVALICLTTSIFPKSTIPARLVSCPTPQEEEAEEDQHVGPCSGVF